MAAIDQVKADLVAVQTDLDSIKSSVGTTISAQQAQITDLTTKIGALKAGDVLTEQQLIALGTAADVVKQSADDTLAAVQPKP